MGNGKGKLVIGRKKANVVVCETTINSFTLEISKSSAKKAKSAKRVTLLFDGRQVEMVAMTPPRVEGKNARITFQVIRELEQKEKFRLRIPSLFGFRRDSPADASQSVAAYGGVVLLSFASMALPGLGDHLGTAPRIESAVEMMVSNIKKTMRNGW